VFNIGPMELLVLALVGLIVIGPDKLPGLARDAARMLRTLREMATGARTQLREELGPEFADLDLRSLNPRTAIQRALLGDDDLSDLNPRNALREAMSDQPPPTPPPARPSGERPLARGEKAPFDEDAT
jgi:sec-independent protein translocase protein TatB